MKLYSNYYYIGSIHHVVSVLSGACRWPLPEDGGGVKRMLDIGCGPGNSTAVLRERYPHAKILGVDSSPDMIEAARKAYPDIDFQLCDVSRIGEVRDVHRRDALARGHAGRSAGGRGRATCRTILRAVRHRTRSVDHGHRIVDAAASALGRCGFGARFRAIAAHWPAMADCRRGRGPVF